MYHPNFSLFCFALQANLSEIYYFFWQNLDFNHSNMTDFFSSYKLWVKHYDLSENLPFPYFKIYLIIDETVQHHANNFLCLNLF